jgi:hypothetical protein
MEEVLKKDDSIFIPLDEYIAEHESRPMTAFYPSSASCRIGDKVVGGCLRQQYWKYKREPVDGNVSYRTWMAGRLGSAFEKAFVEGYRGMGLIKSQNQKFRIKIMGVPISGETDAITKSGEVIECKSAYGKAFAYAIARKPKPEHLCQIMVYLAVLGLDTCLLPYGSRDDTGIRQGYIIHKKDIEAEGILFIKIIQRWKILQLCLETNLLPERDFSFDDWQCRYCSYRKKCYRSAKSIDIIPK